MEANLFPTEGWLGSFGYGAGDHPTGMALLSAVMLALFARERSGRGTRVSSSLLASGAWSNSVMIQAKLLGAQFLERILGKAAVSGNFSTVTGEQLWLPQRPLQLQPIVAGDG